MSHLLQMFPPIKPVGRSLVRLLAGAGFLAVTALSADAAVTVTDENGVVYTIIQGTTDVKVSSANASVFKDSNGAVVIPAQLTDHSTTTTDPTTVYTVVALDDDAFRGTSISSMTIEAEVESIPSSAFRDCMGLTEISFPPTVTAIGDNAFEGAYQLSAVGAMAGVKSIGVNSFAYCYSLLSIELPEGLTDLSEGSFRGSALAEVEFPSTLTSIPKEAFADCGGLERLTFPSTLRTIGELAFSSCGITGDLEFHEGMEIFPNAFQYTYDMGKLYLKKDMILHDGAFNSSGMEEVIWPDEPLQIGEAVFSQIYKLSKISIPGWMKEIPVRTFAEPKSLVEVELHAGVETIREHAFSYRVYSGLSYRNSLLTRVYFAEGEENTLKNVGSEAFYNEMKFCEFPFAPGQTIAERAFYNCGFKALTLYEGMTLKESAFDTNTTMTSIVWPEQPLASIGNNPFGKQTVITSFTIPGWMETVPDNLCNSWSALTTLVLEEGVKTIGTNSFYNCTKLSSITFPETLTEIGRSAFCNLPNQTLTFPSSLRTIGYGAFSGCKIGTLKFNEGLESIGELAFSGSSAMAVTFPTTLKSLGAYAFSNAFIMSVNLSQTALTSIPDHAFAKTTVTNYSVNSIQWPPALEEIGAGAFQNHRLSLVSEAAVFLPETVRKIGDSAFASNRYTVGSNYFIRTLNLENIEQLGANAFQGVSAYYITMPENPIPTATGWFSGNTAIHEFRFPDWMTVIPDEMFKGAVTLHKIDFNNVGEIGMSAFEGCSNIGTGYCIQCDPAEPYGEILVDYPRVYSTVTFQLPSTISKIGQKAFASTGQANGGRYTYDPGTGTYRYDTAAPQPYRLLVDSDLEIGEDAFYNANISELEMTGCVGIGQRAFGNTKVKRLVLPGCMTDIPAGLCREMSDLEEVVFPEGVKSIGDEAFAYCSNLKLSAIPATVETIGEAAFTYCSSITDLILPPNLASMGSYAFNRSGVTSIQWPSRDFEMGISCFPYTQIESLDIPGCVTCIPDGTFSSCANLREVTWQPRGGNQVSIGGSAFSQCSNLVAVNLPEELTSLGEYCFYRCPNLETVDIPAQVTEIPKFCFFECEKLGGTFPSHVCNFGEAAYSGTAYRDIVIGDGVEEIPVQCFANCYSMENLSLGENVKTIGDNAFYPCSRLTELILPEGLEKIGTYAFTEPYNLQRLELPSSLKEVGHDAFSCSLGWVELWDEGASAPDFAASLLEREGCPRLEEVVNHSPDVKFVENAFSGNYGLKRYISDYSPEEIGTGMFSECVNLTDVIFPEGTKIPVIWERAFMNCFSLKEFNYPVIVHIGTEAFYDCYSLTNFTFPTGEDYIIPADAPATWLVLADRKYDDEEGLHHAKRSFYDNNRVSEKYNIWYFCRNLQSITIPYTDPYLSWFNLNIIGFTPLKGVSYCYAKGMIPNTYQLPAYYEMGYKPSSTIVRQFGLDDTYRDESILMVSRGEKWKYIDAGYDTRFTIKEMKEPKPVIDADIFSNFNKEENINSYTVKLRWDLQLSDLNEDGETYTEVMRDGRKIGSVTFSKPEEVAGQSVNISADKVIKVDISVEGSSLKAEFQGDYTYPVMVSRNQYYNSELMEENNTLWILDYNKQDTNALYFDAYTGRRLNAYERYGYDSWLTLTDSFDSPRLDEAVIPDKYVYTVTMKGYDYQEYVNNDGYQEGEDGHFWHLETRSLPDLIISDDCEVRPNIGWLTVDFDGLYTTEEVKADTDGSLQVTPSHRDGREYRLVNHLDAELVKEQVYVVEYDQAHNIIEDFSTYALDADNRAILSVDPALTISDDVRVIGKEYDPKPMDRYQTVVTTFSRGTFGSPVVTIPDSPVLESAVQWGYADHYNAAQNAHSQTHGKVEVTLLPDATPMGYPSALPATADDFKTGVWCKHSSTGTRALENGEITDPDNLLYHWDALFAATPSCPVCASEAHDDFLMTDYDNNQLSYIHLFSDDLPKYTNRYENRMYFKVPAGMLRTPEDRWMMAAATNLASTAPISGLDEIDSDAVGYDGSDVHWYNLQGIEVANPQPGTVYIRVAPEGNSKVVYSE